MKTTGKVRGMLLAILVMSTVVFTWSSALSAENRNKVRLSPDIVELSKKELQALELTGKWSRGGVPPFLADGKLVYVHGAGGTPTVIAAPMQVSDVELQPGEKINEIVVGDSARWMVAEGMSGTTAHLFIKPVDSGLESTAVITTDRRVYHLRLISRQQDHIPYIGFVYSSDLQAEVRARSAREEKEERWKTTETPQGERIDLAALNFNYEVNGKASWKPERVYDDGRKTYIQLPESTSSGEIPALLVRKGNKDVLVNYRVKGQTMEVDGLFETIALVTGVGSDQEAVEVSRKGSRTSLAEVKAFRDKEDQERREIK